MDSLRTIYRKSRTWTKYLAPAIWRWQKSLIRRGGSGALSKVPSILRSFAAANSYTPWTSWSLHPEACLVAADLIDSASIARVVEFGAGYSTVFLNTFLSARKNDATTVASFEHQEYFSNRLSSKLRDSAHCTLLSCQLVQVSDEVFSRMLLPASDAFSLFEQYKVPVPQERYRETRLKNAFYDYQFSEMEDASIDLIILDGPNGNGRSLAYALLKPKLRMPCWILIDDYEDYPFLDQLALLFEYEMVYSRHIDENEFALLRVTSPRA